MPKLSLKGASKGASELRKAVISKVKAEYGRRKLVQRSVGDEGTFGRKNQNKQKKKLDTLSKRGNYRGMREYMRSQRKKAKK